MFEQTQPLFDGKHDEESEGSELDKAGLEHKSVQDRGQYYGKPFKPKSPDEPYKPSNEQIKSAEGVLEKKKSKLSLKEQDD